MFEPINGRMGRPRWSAGRSQVMIGDQRPNHPRGGGLDLNELHVAQHPHGLSDLVWMNWYDTPPAIGMCGG
jgi:hypothetical protein